MQSDFSVFGSPSITSSQSQRFNCGLFEGIEALDLKGGKRRLIEILDTVLHSVGEVAADSCISPLPWFLHFLDKNDP